MAINTSVKPTRSSMMRGTAQGTKGGKDKQKEELKPFEGCKATMPNLRCEWDGGVTVVLIPWIAQSEVFRMGDKLAVVFGNVEITLHRKHREAEKAGWRIEEVLDLLQDQKLRRLRDDPELGCSLQAFRLETNADGETERHALVERYEESGIGVADEGEEGGEGPGEEEQP